MSAYAIAHLTMTDAEGYRQYTSRFMPILRQYRGRILMGDDHVRVLEGEPPAGRHVILEFDDVDAAERWYQSPEYQAILPHRTANSVIHFVAIGRGIPRPAAAD